MTTPFNWKAMEPQDGYFAVLNIAGEVAAELSFGLYSNGKVLKSKLIAKRSYPTARIIGDLKRQMIFWEGVAEYMNAGGNLNCLRDDVYDLAHEFDGQIKFTGWSYFDTGINPMTGNRVHEFISDAENNALDMRFVRWVRGEYIDVNLTAESMRDVENHGANDTPTETKDIREIGLIPKRQADEQADTVPGPQAGG